MGEAIDEDEEKNVEGVGTHRFLLLLPCPPTVVVVTIVVVLPLRLLHSRLHLVAVLVVGN